LFFILQAEYLAADEYTHLGRKMKEETKKKKYKPTIWMADDVPLSIASIVNLFSVSARFTLLFPRPFGRVHAGLL
jgi:hypothetical protein